MKNKRAFLCFIISAALIITQAIKKYDGVLGFLMVLFAVGFMVGAITLGGYVKETLKLSLEALIEALISLFVG